MCIYIYIYMFEKITCIIHIYISISEGGSALDVGKLLEDRPHAVVGRATGKVLDKNPCLSKHIMA